MKLFVAVLGLGLLATTTIYASTKANKSEPVLMAPEAMEWKDGPSSLPADVKMSVLNGDPNKKGPFTVRLKIPANTKIAPHTHPITEFNTVISGSLRVETGDKLDGSNGTTLPAGSFLVLPAKMAHQALAEEEVVLQISGMGPWGMTYLNATDDPRKQSQSAPSEQ